ncbi:MAG: hypothetical protein DI535_07400 [Citrobacter freundii]|nr:MAG: hypothetical protein DI535_07400 [Citrobacter freundii]
MWKKRIFLEEYYWITMLIYIFRCTALFMLCFIISNRKAAAQSREEKERMTDFRAIYYKMSPATDQVALPVSFAEVHDIRFDTTYIGLANRTHGQPQFIRLSSGGKELSDQFNSCIRADAGAAVLHCFIRKLFLTDHISVKKSEEVRMASPDFDKNEMSGVFLTVDFYEQRGEVYQPLFRFDTTVASYIRINKKGYGYLEEAIRAAISKAGRQDWNRIREKAPKLTRSHIDSVHALRLALPVLNTSPVKGIFYTFNDFKQNTPSTQEFTVDRGKKGDFLYLKNAKQEEILQKDIWGYCDGKDSYIYSAGNFFKLHRTGNGFTLYGAKELTGDKRWNPTAAPVQGGGVYVGSSPKTVYILEKQLFQLDMESGKIY